MAHFYLDEQLAGAVIGDRVSIVGTEARHAVTVSRLAVGELVGIGNGAGLVVSGAVTLADHDRLELEVAEVRDTPRPSPTVFLAQALAKGGRDELAVQAATELGVDGVIPWAAARSIVRWEGAKAARGRDRWAALVREASKQSLRPWLPDVLDLASTRELVRLAGSVRMLVLEPTAGAGLAELASDPRDTVVLVGPEGGIAPQELDALTAAGASLVRLGAPVLRTSTAGPAALAVLNVVLGRW